MMRPTPCTSTHCSILGKKKEKKKGIMLLHHHNQQPQNQNRNDPAIHHNYKGHRVYTKPIYQFFLCARIQHQIKTVKSSHTVIQPVTCMAATEGVFTRLHWFRCQARHVFVVVDSPAWDCMCSSRLL